MTSSVDWLMKKMAEQGSIMYDDWLQAKEMHKQEIIKSFEYGVEDDGYIDNAEQYYQETFKQD